MRPQQFVIGLLLALLPLPTFAQGNPTVPTTRDWMVYQENLRRQQQEERERNRPPRPADSREARVVFQNFCPWEVRLLVGYAELGKTELSVTGWHSISPAQTTIPLDARILTANPFPREVIHSDGVPILHEKEYQLLYFAEVRSVPSRGMSGGKNIRFQGQLYPMRIAQWYVIGNGDIVVELRCS